MTPTQSIEVQLSTRSGSDLHVENVLLEIDFFTGGNYRYGFIVGKTDSKGHLKVSFDDIERCRVKNARENVMDYNTRLEACDPTIRIAVPSDQQLRDRVKTGIRFYGGAPEWADPWPANVRVIAVEEQVALVGNATTVRVQAG